MSDPRRFIIRHSVEDVLGILEREPVQRDLFPEITAVQLLNRVSLAHLSIERAIKFLITEAGGSLVPNHHLGHQYRELLQRDRTSAEGLQQVFEAAIEYYRYNPNAPGMTHLKTLEGYLATAGSGRAFRDMRYWELTQSRDEILLQQLYLSVHMELLHGISQILIAPDRPVQTVADRVEFAVRDAMWPAARMAYGLGTPGERSVRSYMEWHARFSTCRDALAVAVGAQFDIGDAFMRETVSSAYQLLLRASDPAVSYYVNTLDILPRQQRDVIPCVEWRRPDPEREGLVSTPAGTPLGIIERGADGIWYITPLSDSVVRASAKASTQTDARCYLATLLTREARIMVGSDERHLRIVGRAHNWFWRDSGAILSGRESDEKTSTHRITFWNQDHGIDIGDNVLVEVQSIEQGPFTRRIEGTATEVAEHEVYLSGFAMLEVKRSDPD